MCGLDGYHSRCQDVIGLNVVGELWINVLAIMEACEPGEKRWKVKDGK